MRFIPSLLIIGLVCIESSLSADYWALIAVGSNGWDNYRHQADACHAYQVMLNKGVPAGNIVVMMYDDIAYNKMNETPGKIINRPNGTNVYTNVAIDYKGEDVSAQNFIGVLTGNQSSLNGIGTGRVLKSSTKSTIFVNIIGHGGQGLMLFPNDELKASMLQSALLQMRDNKRFGKIVFYVESCDSGSLFDGVITNKNDIIAITAAPQNEPSYAWYCIKYTRGTHLCLGDEFSITWMEHADETVGKYEMVFDQYEYVRHQVTHSHVSIYGDLTIGANVLRPPQNPVKLTKSNDFEFVNNRDMALYLSKGLDESLPNFQTNSKYDELIKRRVIADNIMNDLTMITANRDETVALDIIEQQYPLDSTITGCYDNLVGAFSEKCYKWTENPYFLKHLRRFVNICAMGLNVTVLQDNMRTVCSKEEITEPFL